MFFLLKKRADELVVMRFCIILRRNKTKTKLRINYRYNTQQNHYKLIMKRIFKKKKLISIKKKRNRPFKRGNK